MELSASGNGHVLISLVHPSPEEPDLMYELHRTEIIGLANTLIQLSGATPGELWAEADSRGMVNRKENLSRQQRRHMARREKKLQQRKG